MDLCFKHFVILNFADVSKEGINFSAKKWENENVSKFWITGILKGFVIIVSNQSILTNTFFHYGTIWIKKNFGAPKGTILKKSNELFDHACLGNGW